MQRRLSLRHNIDSIFDFTHSAIMKYAQLSIQADRSLEGSFLHGVDLSNRVLVHNISISGRLLTTDVMGVGDPGLAATHRIIDEISVGELASTGLAGNVLAPRAVKYFVPAAILESGQRLMNGYGELVEFSEGRVRRILETRDIELVFEEGRRRFAPSAPSRLACIWLAEDSYEGRGAIRSMVHGAFIADVKVPFCARVAVADASWFNDYLNGAGPNVVEKYWTGEAHREPCPEILVEGVVEFTNAEQLEHIKSFWGR
jgi:hypothetical protein